MTNQQQQSDKQCQELPGKDQSSQLRPGEKTPGQQTPGKDNPVRKDHDDEKSKQQARAGNSNR